VTAPAAAPVIVGVDGGAAAEDALVFARWAADTLAAPLVVAVVHPAPSAVGSSRRAATTSSAACFSSAMPRRNRRTLGSGVRSSTGRRAIVR